MSCTHKRSNSHASNTPVGINRLAFCLSYPVPVLAQPLHHAFVRVAILKIAATDYVDLGGGSVATKILDNALPLKAESDSTSLLVSLVSNGTPTYGAAGDVIATLTFARS